MAKPSLTVHEAKELDYLVLIERIDAIMSAYDAPGGNENPQEQHARLSRTLDEMPDVYRWFLILEGYFDHWTDAMNDQFGTKAREYRQMRQKRDLMKNMASAAKRRYEGASRLVTIVLSDEEQMPRGRGA